jgi:hypothetical protein
MVSCMGFLLRHCVDVSYAGCGHGGHQCNLIMYHNNLNVYLFIRGYHGGS